jgi:hypothetical protein
VHGSLIEGGELKEGGANEQLFVARAVDEVPGTFTELTLIGKDATPI